MDSDATHDQVAKLDERIEALAAAIERCRKIDLAAKVAIAVGGLWLLVTLLGVFRGDAATLIGAAALLLGGIVVLGSNATTTRQTMADLEVTETQRRELIGRLDLRVVSAQV